MGTKTDASRKHENKGEYMETKLKATPGPWELHETGAIVGPKIDDKPIWLRPVIARFETGVKRGDALLMAAATDLLEFAQEWLDSQGTDENYMVAKARAALAKARGEQ